MQEADGDYPIAISRDESNPEELIILFPNGKLYDNEDTECVIFPSREQRNWRKFNKFDPCTRKPFDKMLVKTHSKWDIEFFGYYDKESKTISGMNEDYTCYAIPFNEDTEHLLGTSEDCDEFYKWWEE